MWYFYVIFLLQSFITVPLILIGFVIASLFFLKNKNYRGNYFFSSLWKPFFFLTIIYNLLFFINYFVRQNAFANSLSGAISSDRNFEVFYLSGIFQSLTIPIFIIGLFILIYSLFKKNNILIFYGLSVLLPVSVSVFSGAVGFVTGFGNTPLSSIFWLVAQYGPFLAYSLSLVVSLFILLNSKTKKLNSKLEINKIIDNLFDSGMTTQQVEKYFLKRGVCKNDLVRIIDRYNNPNLDNSITKRNYSKNIISIVLFILIILYFGIVIKNFFEISKEQEQKNEDRIKEMQDLFPKDNGFNNDFKKNTDEAKETSQSESNNNSYSINLSIKEINEKILESFFDLSSIGFGTQAKIIDYSYSSSYKGPSLGGWVISPSNTYVIAKIAIISNNPPWDIYLAIIDVSSDKYKIIDILDPFSEVPKDLIKEESTYNFEIFNIEDNYFIVKFYDTSTRINEMTFEVEYEKKYYIENNLLIN